MPIKNVTEIYRPVRQGKIHLGIKVKKECPQCKGLKTVKDKACTKCRGEGFIEYPKEVDYFVIPEELTEFYGEQPKELNINMPSARFEKDFKGYLEKVFPQYLKRYRGGKESGVLVCKGNGELASCIDEETKGLKQRKCPCEELEKNQCRKVGIFRFRVREIASLNVYQISTSSYNSLVNLNSFLRDFLEHCLVYEVDPSLVHLILRRKTQPVQRLEEGKARSSIHHILELDLDPASYRSLAELRTLKHLYKAAEIAELPPPDESRDDLLFPANGFAPKAEEKEPEKPPEETPKEDEALKEEEAFKDAEAKAKREQLNFAITELEKFRPLTAGEKKRNNELVTPEELDRAIEYFREQLKKYEDDTKGGVA